MGSENLQVPCPTPEPPDHGEPPSPAAASGRGAKVYLKREDLAHTGAPVDEEVWLTRDDVAQGRDTVVEAAIKWINSRHPRHPTGRRQPGGD